ncbi:MAG TPA: type II secretion system F family protein, partial [Clostridia bacterium]|nr:type II secretion system F family protein [Clostridia bacterium]
MPLYNYKVKNESGKIFTGQIKIGNKGELEALLSNKGLTPVEIQERNFVTDITQIGIFKKKVKLKDLAVFCRQFAIIMEAGVPLMTAMTVLKEETVNPTMRECLSDIEENVQKGISLSTSMKKRMDVFPELLINMVDAGEVSGQLERVFKRMADYYENEFTTVNKIKSAMIYPIIVCCVAAVITIVMLTFVLPNYANVLKQFNATLPLPTKIVIGTSTFFKKFWWLILIAITGTVVAIRYYKKTDEGRRFFGKTVLKIPIVNRVIKNIMTARLARTLGTLVASGVLLIQALETVQKVMGNVIISEKLGDVITEIKKGRGLTIPLSDMNYFPTMLISMVRVGEESGELDFALNKSADFYDQEAEVSLQ